MLGTEDVKYVSLSDIEIDGVKKRGNVDIEVSAADSTLALHVARGVIDCLVDKHQFRILDAVQGMTANGKHMEHDLIGERRCHEKRSSIEVNCKSIKKEEVLETKFREQMRKAALKLWVPSEFSERVVVLVEFDYFKDLSRGYRCIRVETYNGCRWISLQGWGGIVAPAAVPPAIAAPSNKRKRKSEASPPNATKHVCLAKDRYTTLPQYLGRDAVKSELNVASASCGAGRVEMRCGDWKTLSGHWGEELLPGQSAFREFHKNKWVDACIANARPDRAPLQIKLLKNTEAPRTRKFLWRLAELERCSALKKQ